MYTVDWYNRKQGETLRFASRNGDPWTDEENRFIEEHKHLTDADIAIALHRTMNGVRAHRCSDSLLSAKHDLEEFTGVDEFVCHSDALIGAITIRIHAGHVLQVWCPTGTHRDLIRDEFVRIGYGEGLFALWLQESGYHH